MQCLAEGFYSRDHPSLLTEAGHRDRTFQREKLGRIKREGDKVLWKGLQGCAPKSLWLYWNLVSCIDGLYSTLCIHWCCQPGCDHIPAPLGILSVATGTTRHHSLPPLLLGVSYR